MDNLAWRVIAFWKAAESEFTQTAAFATLDDARRQVHSLCPMTGSLENGKVLQGIRLEGDFDAMLASAGGGAKPCA